MSARGGAAPEAVAASERGLRSTGSTEHTPLRELPAALLQRLAAHGITTCEAWRAIGAKRRMIWGVTRRASEQVDAAVAALLKRGRP
jgi:hypothetical protein